VRVPKIPSQPSHSSRIINNKDDNTTTIESGLDHILSYFEEPLFPRKISTYKSNNKQFLVRTREEVIDAFTASNFVDCRINAYPYLTDYKGSQRYKPNFIFIDLDKNNFKSERSFKLALSTTLQNIKDKLLDSNNNAYPTVLETGGGYHIYQPIECPKILVDGVLETVVLENIKEFSKFDRPSEQFLRFAKNYLSNGKADKQNNPSFKSCLLRIPGSINSKYNRQVKIVQQWNGIRPPIPREFIEEFRTFLIQKKIDEAKQRQKMLKERLTKNRHNNNYNINNNYDWIEKKVLQTKFEDYRKLIVGLILVPYLIVIKKLSYEQSYKIINEWLQKCDSVRKIDFDPRYLINNSLKTSMKKLIPPISIYKLEMNYRNLYLLLLDQNNDNKTNDIRMKELK